MYKFKSKASADVIMLATHADKVLSAMGKTPTPQGIIEVADLPAAIHALTAAVEADEALHHALAQSAGEIGDSPAETEHEMAEHVSLRQRAWPLVDMMKRSLAEQRPVVWGV